MNFRTEWFNASEPYIHIYAYGFDLLPCFSVRLPFSDIFFSLTLFIPSLIEVQTVILNLFKSCEMSTFLTLDTLYPEVFFDQVKDGNN